MKPENKYDELKGMNSGLPEQNPTPYSVPEGYFDHLAESIMAKVKSQPAISSATEEIAALSPLLAGITRTMPYYIPNEYFQETISNLPVLITDIEESPILSSIGRSLPYQVPSGYFDQFASSVLNKLDLHKSGSAPIVRMRWMRMAAAAMVAGIVTISGFFYFTHRSNAGLKDPVAQQLKNVSTSDLEDFLKNTDPILTNSATAQNASKPSEAEVSKMVQDVPDKELETFLKQIPADEEILTN